MKTVILAGGFGTRISEETGTIPKPLVKIGNIPILYHIMDYYRKYNHKDFIICAGYKSTEIKKFFLEINLQNSNLIIDFKKKTTDFVKKKHIDWKVNIIDTGEKTQTGARIKKIKNFIDDKCFMMTYGDGLSNVDISKLLAFHKKHKKIATMTAVRPLARFGNLNLEKSKVTSFTEKDSLQEGWINGGFFVLNKEVFDYIGDEEDCIFEKYPLENLAKDNQLMAYKHEGFWHPMDTLRDKIMLNNIYKEGKHKW